MEEKRMAGRQRESERTTENKTATDWTRTDGRGRVWKVFRWCQGFFLQAVKEERELLFYSNSSVLANIRQHQQVIHTSQKLKKQNPEKRTWKKRKELQVLKQDLCFSLHPEHVKDNTASSALAWTRPTPPLIGCLCWLRSLVDSGSVAVLMWQFRSCSLLMATSSLLLVG